MFPSLSKEFSEKKNKKPELTREDYIRMRPIENRVEVPPLMSDGSPWPKIGLNFYGRRGSKLVVGGHEDDDYFAGLSGDPYNVHRRGVFLVHRRNVELTLEKFFGNEDSLVAKSFLLNQLEGLMKGSQTPVVVYPDEETYNKNHKTPQRLEKTCPSP